MTAELIHFQPDMFETPTERMLRMQIERLELRLNTVATSNDKVRKGTYASINKVRGELEELSWRLASVEKGLCQGNLDKSPIAK